VKTTTALCVRRSKGSIPDDEFVNGVTEVVEETEEIGTWENILDEKLALYNVRATVLIREGFRKGKPVIEAANRRLEQLERLQSRRKSMFRV